ncbi:acyl-CoA dehydrogenase family protein [Microbacterium sp. RD1]|uniref:acyl-CoA dehydrogenase family protein n=1 Tax=Microbacterium sp. RD1 TaxID=3457313 RepID=UPI003FA5775C
MTPSTAALLEADLFGFQSELTERESEKIAEVREFLDVEVRPQADDYWERGQSPRHLLKRGGELGIFGCAFAETSQFENSATFRGWLSLEIARCDPSTAVLFGVHSGLAMGAIAATGSDEQRAEWLPLLASGQKIAAFGLTEPGHGSDTARGLETVAERRGDEWILNGAKRWIGNGTFADVVVVWARDIADGSVKGFLVRTPAVGFSATKIQRKISMRAVENADIVLDGVVVSEHDRLEHANGFRDVAGILKHTRLESAWHAVGTSMGAFDAALAYAREREQFGRPIASFQLVQQKFADISTNITTSLALCMRASALLESRRLEDHHASMTKAFSAARMRATVALCREITGGNGVQLDTGVARYFSDAEAIYTFEGTHEMNSLIVARTITGMPAFV